MMPVVYVVVMALMIKVVVVLKLVLQAVIMPVVQQLKLMSVVNVFLEAGNVIFIGKIVQMDLMKPIADQQAANV